MTPYLLASLIIIVLAVCATIIVCVHKTINKVDDTADANETIAELSRCLSDVATTAMNAALTPNNEQIERIRSGNESNEPEHPSGQSIQFPGPIDRMIGPDYQEVPRNAEG